MSLSSRTTSEAKENGIEKLSELVKDMKFDEIKKIVSHAKAAKTDSWRWCWSDKNYVEGAVRDAILLGQIETVRYFLQEGVSVNAHAYGKGNSGYVSSLISFAAESGNLPMVKLLVEHEADIRPRDDYFNRGDDSAIRAAVKTVSPRNSDAC